MRAFGVSGTPSRPRWDAVAPAMMRMAENTTLGW